MVTECSVSLAIVCIIVLIFFLVSVGREERLPEEEEYPKERGEQRQGGGGQGKTWSIFCVRKKAIKTLRTEPPLHEVS